MFNSVSGRRGKQVAVVRIFLSDLLEDEVFNPGYNKLKNIYIFQYIRAWKAVLFFRRRLKIHRNGSLCRLFTPPDIDLARNLLHHPILDHLFGAVMGLLEAIGAFLECAIESLHGLRLCKVIAEGQVHRAEVGPALLYSRGCLRAAVMVVDAPRRRGRAPHFLVVLQFIGQVRQVCGNLLVSQREEFIVRWVEDFLEPAFVEGGFPGHHLFAGLLDLNKDRNDQEYQNDPRRNTNDCAMSLCDLFK